MQHFLCGLAKTIHFADICALLWESFVLFCFLWLSREHVLLILDI